MKNIIIIFFLLMSGLSASTYLIKVQKKNEDIVVKSTLSTKPYTLNCSRGTLNDIDKTCTYIDSKSTILACLNGYTEYNTTQCYKTNYRSSIKSCSSGYEAYSSTKCRKLSITSATQTCSSSLYSIYNGQCLRRTSATPLCPTGYKIDDSWDDCQLKSTSYIYANSCPAEYSNYTALTGSGQYLCSKYGAMWVPFSGYTCNSGLILNGNKCLNPSDTQEIVYTCSTGYTFNGTNCEKYIYRDYNYSCPTGYTLNGTNCEQTQYSNKVETCDSGYILNNNNCEQTIIENATISFPLNYQYNSEKDVCEK